MLNEEEGSDFEKSQGGTDSDLDLDQDPEEMQMLEEEEPRRK